MSASEIHLKLHSESSGLFSLKAYIRKSAIARMFLSLSPRESNKDFSQACQQTHPIPYVSNERAFVNGRHAQSILCFLIRQKTVT